MFIKVLVVDDDLAVSRALGRIFGQNGIRFDYASNGQAALYHLANETYDVILSDVDMPVMTGPQFYEAVRGRYPRLRDRFVFMTGNPDAVKDLRVPIVVKPFDPNVLISALFGVVIPDEPDEESVRPTA